MSRNPTLILQTAAFRPGAASGVWCCFLPTLALASALYDCDYDASAVKPIKIVTLALSGFLAATSVVAAYEILYRSVIYLTMSSCVTFLNG